MIISECRTVGTIQVSVYETVDKDKFFGLQANTEDVLPILYVLEEILKLYK